MAIKKKLIHFNTFANFNTKKLSANETNTTFTIGVNGDVQNGEPEILYQSIVWIRDTKQQWTHGTLYDCSEVPANVQAVDTSETLDDVETNTYIKYVPQTLTDEQKAQARENIGVSEGGTTDLSEYAKTEDLSQVAFTGSYDDLKDKPSIPSAVTESTISNWGFTKNAGTVTGIKMNGASKGSSGVIDLGTVITEHQDITGKQDKLVSGTNIKTINGTSLLGSGNITLSGGEGGSGTVYWDDIKNKPIVETLLTEENGSKSSVTRMNISVLGDPGGDSVNFSRHGIVFYDAGVFRWKIHKGGDGTKFLSDKGEYKAVYTKTEIDTKLGDINSILESIINT